MRTREEIEDQISAACHSGSSKWPGMTYEEGVDQALRWALEDDDNKPMEEE
jgi:hypothetical protein